MSRRYLRVVVVAAATLAASVACSSSLLASPIVIDFEKLADGAPVDSEYPGVIFSNATVVTAGISLNELEFPPFSGFNVAYDDGGPMRLDFDAPVFGYGGYFTYSRQLWLEAFDASNVSLGSIASAFGSNLAVSGDAGSSPNEFLFLAVGNIDYITVTGDPAGGSFTVDNLQAVPEPGTISLLGLGVAFLVGRRARSAKVRTRLA